MWVVQIIWENSQHDYVVWNVTEAGLSPLSDLAILKLAPHNDVATRYQEWKGFQWTLKPPPVGETIHAFGIRQATSDGSRVNAAGKFIHIEINDERVTATGEVRNIYPRRQDSGFLNFPCYKVDVRFEPGMSGGLVINAASEACGIVCSGNSWDDSSYVAMLFPMMAIELDFSAFTKALTPGTHMFIELARCGVFRPKYWDRLTINKNLENGGHALSLEIPK